MLSAVVTVMATFLARSSLGLPLAFSLDELAALAAIVVVVTVVLLMAVLLETQEEAVLVSRGRRRRYGGRLHVAVAVGHGVVDVGVAP